MREDSKRCVLIFFLDAFRYDYLNHTDTPFILESASEGIYGPLKTILGFDGIAATIFTGTYPEVHDIWTQYSFAPRGGPFDWIRPFSSILSTAERSLSNLRPMQKLLRLVVLELSLLSSGSTHYPGTHRVPFRCLPNFEFSLKRKLYEPNAFGRIPTLFDILSAHDVHFEVADHDMVGGDDRVVRRALKIRGRPKAIYVLLMDLDEVSHTYGIYSEERKEAVRKTDAAVKTVVTHVENAGLDPVIVLFADHGMVSVAQTIDVESAVRETGLKEGQEYVCFLDSTLARFWAERRALTRIENVLRELGRGRVLRNRDLKWYHGPSTRRYGDIFYLADPGTIVLPNYYQGTDMVLAMHGYDPRIPDQDSLFMLSYEDIPAGKINAVHLTDILPTTLDLFGIAKPSYCSGYSLLPK